MKAIIFIYIVTISMVSAFALHPWVPLPMAIAILGCIILFMSWAIKKLPRFYKEDALLCLFLIVCIFSIMSHVVNRKNINHMFSYFAVFFFYLFVIRSLIIRAKPSKKMIYNAVIISVMLASLFAIIEFLFQNTIIGKLGDINQYIYRIEVKDYSPLYTGKIIRARSFVDESGTFALYLNLLGPIAIYYTAEKYSKALLFIVIVVIFTAFIMTFSTGGIVCLFLSSFMTAIYVIIERALIKRKRRTFVSVFRLVFALFAIPIILLFTFYRISGSLLPHTEKITLLSAESSNPYSRVFRWQRALEYWKQSPIFGIGVGEISFLNQGMGTVSWYLEVLAELGLIGFIILCGFIFLIYIRLNSLSTKLKFVYFMSFTNGVIHYAFISNYYYPWIWLIVLLIQIESSDVLKNSLQNQLKSNCILVFNK